MMLRRLPGLAVVALLSAGCGSASNGSANQGTTTGGGAGSGDAGTLADGAPVAGETDGTGGGSSGGQTDTGGGIDAGTVVDTVSTKPADCGSAASCIANCKEGGPAGCVAGCILDTPASTSTELKALLSCVDTTCKAAVCKVGDSACLDDCVDTYCLPELLGCLENGSVGEATCAKGAACIDICNDLDNPWTCLSTCWNGMSANGKSRAAAYAGCAAAAKKAGEKVDGACLVEIATCFGDGNPGTGKCYGIFDCIGACKKAGGTDDVCGLQCVGQLDDAAKAEFKALSGCWEGEFAKTSACQQAFLTCTAPAGTLDCAGALTCAGSCMGGDESKAPGCMFSCMHQSTAAGAKAYLALFSCESSGLCPDKLVTCANPSGSKGCSDTFGCVQACVGGGSGEPIGCVVSCMGAADAQGAKLLAEVMACDDACKKSCNGDGACKEACTKKDCTNQVAACIID